MLPRVYQERLFWSRGCTSRGLFWSRGWSKEEELMLPRVVQRGGINAPAGGPRRVNAAPAGSPRRVNAAPAGVPEED